jgi:hypothetical protein
MSKIQVTLEFSFEGENSPERHQKIKESLEFVLADEVATLLLNDEGLEFERTVDKFVPDPTGLEAHALWVEQTCGACPEQYDVRDSDDAKVGYLRLRHGHFVARVDGVDGRVVYESYPAGDGSFEADERDLHIERALDAIAKVLD